MKPLLTLIIALFILLAPNLSWAQDNITRDGIYTGGGIIPCGQSAANPCNSCDVVVLANTVIKWLIGITFMFFAVMAVITGVKLVMAGGNSGALSDAKEAFTNLFIGLIIVLGAWLFVDTLLRFVLEGGETGNIQGYGPWSQVKCIEETDPTITKMEIEEAEFEAEFVAEGGDSDIDSSGMPISGGSNCPVPAASSMVTIPTQYTGGRSIKIRPDILENFKRMHAAAKADGITLTITSGWRTEDMQVRLWNKYNGKSAVAKPCSMGGGGSNHNSGVAVDMAIGCAKTNSSCSSPAYRWMKANGGRYGFNNALPRDTVHWSPSGR